MSLISKSARVLANHRLIYCPMTVGPRQFDEIHAAVAGCHDHKNRTRGKAIAAKQ
jgi:hypothetical protein